MTNEINSNNPDLSSQRADLEARIARAQDALDFVDRAERECAQIAATMRGQAAVKGSRRDRRQAVRNAQNFETKTAKTRATTRALAKAVLDDLHTQLASLNGPADGTP